MKLCEVNGKYITIMEFNKLRLRVSPARFCKILQAETEGQCMMFSCEIGDALDKHVNQTREFEELCIKLYTVAGFTAERLLEVFVTGYILQKSDYSK